MCVVVVGTVLIFRTIPIKRHPLFFFFFFLLEKFFSYDSFISVLSIVRDEYTVLRCHLRKFTFPRVYTIPGQKSSRSDASVRNYLKSVKSCRIFSCISNKDTSQERFQWFLNTCSSLRLFDDSLQRKEWNLGRKLFYLLRRMLYFMYISNIHDCASKKYVKCSESARFTFKYSNAIST